MDTVGAGEHSALSNRRYRPAFTQSTVTFGNRAGGAVLTQAPGGRGRLLRDPVGSAAPHQARPKGSATRAATPLCNQSSEDEAFPEQSYPQSTVQTDKDSYP